MKKSAIAAGAFLALCTGTASAQVNPDKMNGSDTLEQLTTAMLTSNCFGGGTDLFKTATGTLTYIGGGSGLGESRMLNDAAGPTQQLVSPMSRALNAAACASPRINAAEGIVVGLDALVVTVDSEQSANCGSGHLDRGALTATADKVPSAEPTAGFSDIRASGSVGGATFGSWKDALKLLYFGIHPQAGGTAGTFAACNHADRHALVNSYKNFFEGGCAADGPCDTAAKQVWEEGQVLNTGITHAYRRGDTSGTTDTFISLLGAPAIGTNPFCNGTEKEDRDPIRRKCNQTEQVCEADGTLGVVLPVVVPTISNDANVIFNDRDPNAGASQNWCTTPATKLAQAPTCTSAPAHVRVTSLDGSGDLVTDEITGCSGTTPRCDCRYPASTSTGCKHSNGTPLTAAEMLAYTWNNRAGTACWTGAISPSAGVITRFGVLNGDTGGVAASDNSPIPWGNKQTGHPESTKARCCSSGSPAVWIRREPRVLNLPLRDPANGNLLLGVVNPTPSYYKIHSNDQGRSTVRGNACTSSAVPNAVCKHPDATFQIGCLSQANLPAIAASAGQVAEPSRNCSVGYAGFSAVDGDTDGPGPAHADAFALASIDPTKPNVQNGTYPFTRKLFLSSLVKYTTQFPGITPGGYATSSSNAKAYENLARCYADAAKVYAPAGTSPLEAAGFIPLPGGKPLLCANVCTTNPSCTTLDNPF